MSSYYCTYQWRCLCRGYYLYLAEALKKFVHSCVNSNNDGSRNNDDDHDDYNTTNNNIYIAPSPLIVQGALN